MRRWDRPDWKIVVGGVQERSPPEHRSKNCVIRSQNWSAETAGIVSIQTIDDATVRISGTKAGETVVRAVSADGGIVAACTVRVYEQLSVDAEAEFAYTTTGNDAVWKLNVKNAIDGVNYDIKVMNGSSIVYRSTSYNENNGVVLNQPAPGSYTLSVTVTDGEGEIATSESTIEVSDRITYTQNGIVWSYVITEAQGQMGASIKLVSCPAGIATLNVPASMNGAQVVRIDTEAFLNHTEFVTVGIPGTVTEIGVRAFKGCSSLKSLNYN